MPFHGTPGVGKKGRSGRKGYGIELQKKRLLDLAFHTTKKALLKETTTLEEKEKVDLAKQIVLKELGKNIELDVTGTIILQTPEEEREAIKYYDEHSKTKGSNTEQS